MSKFRFHKLAALAVLAGFSAWIATGEFSTVGSAQSEAKAKSDPAESKAPVRTVAVVTPPRTEHARAIRISGRTEANKRAVLATRANGIIAELPVSQGQRVKAGDLVLKLDAEEKEAMVASARQVLEQREAEAAAAERLVKSGSIAKLQADNVRSALASARSQLEQMQADLGRIEVRAPFDGIIDRVPVERESAVMQGSEVATILNLDPILAKGEVSERNLGMISVGASADVRLVDGTKVTGTIRYISREATPATRTFPIEIAIPNSDGAIPAGMTAEITLRAEPVDAIVLPRSVVTLSAMGDLGIRAVGKDEVVTFYPIDLVDDTPHGLVLGGIPAEARIIVAGQDLVSEGDKVQAVEADAETVRKLAGEVAGGTQ